MSLKIKLKWKERDLPKDWAAFVENFGPYLQKSHRVGVMSIVSRCVAWSRVATGRMRAGWLPYLKANGYPYQSILGTRAIGYKGNQTAEGTFRDMPLRTVVENGVAYTGDVEAGYGVFDTQGHSSFIPAPVGGLEKARDLFANIYAERMQNSIDLAMENWNKGGEGSGSNGVGDYSDMKPPEPEIPSVGH